MKDIGSNTCMFEQNSLFLQELIPIITKNYNAYVYTLYVLWTTAP